MKTVLITGASRGIGAAIAKKLNKSYNLILTYKENKDKALNLLEDLRYQYNKAYSVSLIIQRYIEKEYEYRVSEEEITYLTIHIQRVIHST